MKLLITAFDPFGGESINPALEAVMRLPDSRSGLAIVKLGLPTSFAGAVSAAAAAVERELPDALLCVGQAGGREGMTPERVAINIDDSPIADNDGAMPCDTPICPDGAAAYFSTLPVKAMVERMREQGIPSSLSNTAGTFVCNHLMYSMLRLAEQRHPNMLCGFLHLPFLPEQAAAKQPPAPSLTLEEMLRGLCACADAIADELQKQVKA